MMLLKIVHLFINFLEFTMGFYSLYAVGNIFKSLVKIRKKEYDELEKKAIFDMFVLSLFYIFNKYRYGLITKDQALSPMIVSAGISLFLIIFMLITVILS